jgi:hypothetical protein
LSILSDDAIDSFHIQILMKVVISNVPRSIHDTTDYSILEYIVSDKPVLSSERAPRPQHNNTPPFLHRVLLGYLRMLSVRR